MTLRRKVPSSAHSSRPVMSLPADSALDKSGPPRLLREVRLTEIWPPHRRMRDFSHEVVERNPFRRFPQPPSRFLLLYSLLFVWCGQLATDLVYFSLKIIVISFRGPSSSRFADRPQKVPRGEHRTRRTPTDRFLMLIAVLLEASPFRSGSRTFRPAMPSPSATHSFSVTP